LDTELITEWITEVSIGVSIGGLPERITIAMVTIDASLVPPVDPLPLDQVPLLTFVSLAATP
jgi:hypothetical protein